MPNRVGVLNLSLMVRVAWLGPGGFAGPGGDGQVHGRERNSTTYSSGAPPASTASASMPR
jgi:hypothetical protein